jgi:hypothetical protein
MISSRCPRSFGCIGGCCTSGVISWRRLTTDKVRRKERELRQQVAQLKRLVADKTLEADFFKGALQKVEARRQNNTKAGETASTTESGS